MRNVGAQAVPTQHRAAPEQFPSSTQAFLTQCQRSTQISTHAARNQHPSNTLAIPVQRPHAAPKSVVY
eukprot:4537848-Lingulodinium_polyedra.AAC.1